MGPYRQIKIMTYHTPTRFEPTASSAGCRTETTRNLGSTVVLGQECTCVNVTVGPLEPLNGLHDKGLVAGVGFEPTTFGL